MQIVWEESSYLLLSHQDTHFQKLAGVSKMTQTLTVMVLRGVYFKPSPLWNRLWRWTWTGAAFIHP